MTRTFLEEFLPILNRAWWRQHLATRAERIAAEESARRGAVYRPLRSPAPYPNEAEWGDPLPLSTTTTTATTTPATMRAEPEPEIDG